MTDVDEIVADSAVLLKQRNDHERYYIGHLEKKIKILENKIIELETQLINNGTTIHDN